LPPLLRNVGKRLVKSPKVFVSHSGGVHAVLGIDRFDALAGHPIVGASWEGFVIETLIAAAPDGTTARFHRTSTGAEIDQVLEVPGGAFGPSKPNPAWHRSSRRGFIRRVPMSSRRGARRSTTAR
jgi:predicted AAA+ superfamily ATPase